MENRSQSLRRAPVEPEAGGPPDLRADSPAATRARLVGPARDFLFERHPEATWRALRLGYFGGLTDGEMQDLPRLPGHLQLAIHERAADWLLSEGVLEMPEGPRASFDILLGPQGPALPAEARAWLGALAAEALNLYEVGSRAPDGRLCLRNVLAPGRPLRRVQDDATTTAGLRRGEIVGARVVRWQEDDVVAGAIYPFPRKAARLLGAVPGEVRRGHLPPGTAAGGALDDAATGERLVELFVSQAMTWLWLQGMVRSRR